MTTIPAPPAAPVPQYATKMSSRRPRLKYHANRGHAINAVLYKMYGNSALSEDVQVFRRTAVGDFKQVASWSRGARITRESVHAAIPKI